jgi:hypothetical protein
MKRYMTSHARDGEGWIYKLTAMVDYAAGLIIPQR